MNKSNKDHPEGQPYKIQRSSPRFPPAAFPSLKSACLASGAEVNLINISRGGALLECCERLAPSTRVSLRCITSEGVIQLHGQILRSTISHVSGGLRYRSAVSFEKEFPLQPENAIAESQSEVKHPPEPQLLPPEDPDAHAEPMFASDPQQSADDGLVTLTARVMAEPNLSKLFQISKW